MTLLATLQEFFQRQAPVRHNDLILVAFSGGPDSTALLWGLRQVSQRFGLRLRAVHLDHGMDPQSADRAEAARQLADRLDVELSLHRCQVQDELVAGESPEAGARRLRYGFLEELRRKLGGRYVATGHHRDDQAETVLLRLLFGTGLEGLAGIRPAMHRVIRPLLGLRRKDLLAVLRQASLEPVEDPTNLDLGVPRNRIRHLLLPALQQADPDVSSQLYRVAETARRVNAKVVRYLDETLRPQSVDRGAAISRQEFERLPEVLKGHALAMLHRKAGAPYPASREARQELLRQMHHRQSLGCDCGAQWRWEGEGDRLLLRPHRASVPLFTYTLQVPGHLEIPELSLLFRMSRRAVAPWMFRTSPHRAAMALPLEGGEEVKIRNRRPGDRFQPLGCGEARRLKGVLINHRVPRDRRDSLPLLCARGRIAWVPGVTIDETFRLKDEKTAWVAEVITEHERNTIAR